MRAAADGDAVLAGAADDGGIAVARLDRVVTAGRAGDAAQNGQDAVLEHRLAAVTEDDVVARAGGDGVGAEAADDDVVAIGGGDGVAAADARGRRDDPADDVIAVEGDAGGGRPVLIDLAVVADDDVGATLGVDGVGAGRAGLVDERVGDRDDATDIVEVETRIAEDDVGVGPAGDAVVACAAGDDVAALATDDGVVASAAIDDDEAGRARGVDGVVEADDRAVAIGRALVEEAEGTPRRVRRRGIVAAPVGGGVAEQGEGALRAGHLDGVGAAATMDRGQGIAGGARDGDVVRARAQQQLDRTHATIGDAALIGAGRRAPARRGADAVRRHAEAVDMVGAHRAGDADGGGVVVERDLVEVRLAAVGDRAVHDGVGFARQDDCLRQRPVGRADAALQDDRALDGAEVVGLACEGLDVGGRRRGVGVARHGDPHRPVVIRRREGHGGRVGAVRRLEARIGAGGHGQAVTGQSDRHRRGRRRGQDHVVVGGLRRRHRDAADMGRHHHTGGVAVRHLHTDDGLLDQRRIVEAGGSHAAGDAVGDLRDEAVLGLLVRRRGDEHGLRLVPIGLGEGEIGPPVLILRQRIAVGIGEGELGARYLERDANGLAVLRRVVEDDRVAVLVLRLVAFDDRGAAVALDNGQARLVIVDDLDQHRPHVGAVHLRIRAEHRVADGHALVAFQRRVRLGADEHLLVGGPDVSAVAVEDRVEAQRQGVGPGRAVGRDLDRARLAGERPHLC